MFVANDVRKKINSMAIEAESLLLSQGARAAFVCFVVDNPDKVMEGQDIVFWRRGAENTELAGTLMQGVASAVNEMIIG